MPHSVKSVKSLRHSVTATVMKDEQGRPFIVVREYVTSAIELYPSEESEVLDVEHGRSG